MQNMEHPLFAIYMYHSIWLILLINAGSGQFYSREKEFNKIPKQIKQNKRNFDMILISELSLKMSATVENIKCQEVTEEVHVGKLECCFVLTERSIMTPLHYKKKPDPLIHTTNSDM